MEKMRLKMMILEILKNQELHGYEICRRLAASGVDIQLGYLYRVLSEMKNEGLVKSYWQESGQGPHKKVYDLNLGGKQALSLKLKDAIRTIHDFYGDYLAQAIPAETGLLTWEKAIIGDKAPNVIVFVMTRPSVFIMYKMVLEYYSRKKGEKQIYLIKGQDLELDLNLTTLICLSGSHTDIPLKDDFADITVAFDPPRPKLLHETIDEFHRVTKSNGIAVLGFPNVEEHKDPLSIGAFLERIEYDLGEDNVDREVIESSFKRSFRNVRTAQILNFTFFIGVKKQ
jgi:PadR family transcriptional regulator PadR